MSKALMRLLDISMMDREMQQTTTFMWQHHLEKRFLAFVAAAEKNFGPRDTRFHLVRIGLDPDGPRMDFDALGGTGIIVQINFDGVDFQRADFHLAHEAIHFLGPENDPPPELVVNSYKYPPALMIEEGWAVHFSLSTDLLSEDYRQRAREWIPDNAPLYAEALAIYEKINSLLPNAILNIRNEFPRLCKITSSDLQRLVPGLEAQLADRACSRQKMR